MNQDLTEKKATFVWKKNSCKGFHLKKIPAQAVSKKTIRASWNIPSPPPSRHHFSNGPSLIAKSSICLVGFWKWKLNIFIQDFSESQTQ